MPVEVDADAAATPQSHDATDNEAEENAPVAATSEYALVAAQLTDNIVVARSNAPVAATSEYSLMAAQLTDNIVVARSENALAVISPPPRRFTTSVPAFVRAQTAINVGSWTLERWESSC